MEAAKPIAFETPKNSEIKKSKIIDIKSYDINFENIPYKLEIGKSEDKRNIIFKIYQNKNNLQRKYYYLGINIEGFYNLNIVFKFYQSIDEIYSFLLDIFNKKQFSIKKNENNIVVVVNFLIPGGKNIDIHFELFENKIEKEDMIETLYSTVVKLVEENKLIKEENKLIKEENKSIKERLKNLEEFIYNLKKEENNNIFDLNKSSIVNNKEKLLRLKEWISENGKIKEINLLYRATNDGDNCKKFFEKCGNKGPTVSIIKTKNNRICGGFSTVEWNDKKGVLRLYDKSAFLFSIDNMQKYEILKPEVAIGCYPNEYCLVYGNNGDAAGLFLQNNFLHSTGNYENHETRVYNVPSDYCLTGQNNFNIEEVEVYQVKFN